MEMYFKRSFGIMPALAALLLLGSTQAAFAEEAPHFKIIQERSGGGDRQVVKFNTKTGEAWSNWTTSAPEWSKIAETGPIPQGDYEVLLLTGKNADSNWGLRFDKITGRTWNFGPNGWQEFKEAD